MFRNGSSPWDDDFRACAGGHKLSVASELKRPTHFGVLANAQSNGMLLFKPFDQDVDIQPEERFPPTESLRLSSMREIVPKGILPACL